MGFPAAQIDALKQFCALLNETPEFILQPELSFFKDFLRDFKMPPEPAAAADEEEEVIEMGGDVEDDEPPEERDPEVVEPDKPDPDQVMGEADREPSEAEIELASEAKVAASAALSNGEFEVAVQHYSTAVTLTPSALVYANRANAYLKLKKPKAAIKDCDAALQINPDSAKAYKMRGKAHRMLGDWELAAKDLGTGQNIDYDESLYELQKLVEDKAKRAAERRAARSKNHPSGGSGSSGGPGGGGVAGAGSVPPMGGMPPMAGMGGMPGMGGVPPELINQLMSNPEVMQKMMNPKVMAAMQEVMANPSAAAKYQNDPDFQELFQIFQQTMSS